MKNLIVFNTCAYNGVNIIDVYVNNINTIINQQVDIEHSFYIIVSCVGFSEDMKNEIYQKLLPSNKLDYIFIDDKIGNVALTFNKCVSVYNDFDNFIYMDSGCSFITNTGLNKLINLQLKYDKCGYIYCKTDHDWYSVFDKEIDNEISLFDLGGAANCHCLLINRKIYEVFGRLLSDTMNYCGAESVTSFIAASAGGLKTYCTNDIFVHHHQTDVNPYNHKPQLVAAELVKYFDIYNTFEDFSIANQYAKEFGFGYLEHQPTLEGRFQAGIIHNPNAYNGYEPIYKDQLVEFIKKNLFINDEKFNSINVYKFKNK